MEIELNKTYFGFKLIEEKYINDITSTGRIFIHEKSGAKLVNISNTDDNKVFSISFKTLPEDNTGVFHILEHSVLCGSRKFPCKEPFVELAKGSLNTYLNAATYRDKTMYPVASRNKKDFRNLMDVYLDAVFYPNIYKYPEILKQEGWHYELNSPEDELSYKGVVYNEMQGVYSSPESMLFRGIIKNLFSDTCYGNDSGGNPEEIPELTQKKFLEYHKRFYHPSNSYIYLYGDMDILDELKFIDENYLCDFDKKSLNIEITKQQPFSEMKAADEYYSIGTEEDTKDKTYLSLSFAIAEAVNKELYLAFDLLEDILLETSASPLKKALLDAKICKDAFGMYDNGIAQTSLSIIIKNSNEREKEKFKKIVFSVMKDIVKDGIDKDLINAVINSKEFDLKEGDYSSFPKGLAYCGKVLNSWLYNENPFLNLEFIDTLKKIKIKAENNYFEKLIEKYILSNNHSLLLCVKPKRNLAEEIQIKIKNKLTVYKETLDKERITQIAEDTRKLIERQTAPDKAEDIIKIPLLTLDDVEKKIKEYDSKVIAHGKYNEIRTLMPTNGIDYLYFYFDTKGVKQELIPYVEIISYMLGKIPTEKYTYEQLSNEVNMNTGGIEFGIETYSDYKKVNDYYPKLIVQGKVLHEKISRLYELIFEIINNSKFNNYNRIKEIIDELKSRIEMSLVSGGHKIVSLRVASYFSEFGKYTEITSGLEFYKFLVEVEKNYEKNKEQFISALLKTYKAVININNLVISIGCAEKDYKQIEADLDNIVVQNIKDEEFIEQKYDFALNKSNEALITSTKVQYVAKGFNYLNFIDKYNGKLQVLRNIANYDYLWNTIRVQGGAYGVFINFRRNGIFSVCSYRDPNIKETIESYDNFYKYLSKFEADDRQMTKYILGTISNYDVPLTNSMICEKEAVGYICNINTSDLQTERNEILSTKIEDIRKFAPMIEECMKQNYLCVLGGKEKIEENINLFNNTVNIFE